jgi:hypothetical protein
VTTATSETAEAAAQPVDRRRRRGFLRHRWVWFAALLAAAALVVNALHPHGVDFQHPFGQSSGNRPASHDNGAATATAKVSRGTLSARTSLDGTLGYAGDYSVGGQAHGTITWLPRPGAVIRQGHVLYRVDAVPVVLLYGRTPAYRNLAEGATAADVTGRDVAQLNRDLVALGYGRSAGLERSSNEFSWATKVAIKQLQKDLGANQTGQLDLGQVVFLPNAVRVTSLTATVGGPAGGEAFKASSTAHRVGVDLDAAQQSELKVGDKVTITLPNGRTTPGKVTSVGKVATTPQQGSDNSSTVPVTIKPTNEAAAGTLDQAPVQVAITTATVRHALVVPVNALLALAGGGYAVEVVAHGARHLVAVTLGLFDDSTGMVQVTGTELVAGQRVVVPAS